MRKSTKITIISILLFTFANASTADEFDKFGEYSQTTKYTLSYDHLDMALNRLVLEMGLSQRFYERPKVDLTYTRISTSNLRKSWLENNRVLYHQLEEENVEVLRNIRMNIASFMDEIEYSDLSRNEQLAYWLNLHNIAVIEAVAERYPVKLLRGLKKRRGVWNEDRITVAGVQMSIADIENNIIKRFWHDTPIAMYGLYMGDIGGPRINGRAFYVRNLWNDLDQNALEFVNSLRGVDGDDDEIEVSKLYEDFAVMFPNFQADLRAHLRRYADYQTLEILSVDEEIEPDYYDYLVTDLLQGHRNDTRTYRTTFGFDASVQIEGGWGTEGEHKLGNAEAHNYNTGRPRQLPAQYMSQMSEAFRDTISVKFQIYGYPDTVIRIQEVRPGEEEEN